MDFHFSVQPRFRLLASEWIEEILFALADDTDADVSLEIAIRKT